MPNITTCTRCGDLYEAGSEEQANEPERWCPPCRTIDRVKLTPNSEDRTTLTRIYRRADRLGLVVEGTMVDLAACHLNGCPLDLQRLLEARAFDFAHDIYGISRHIDRNTGKLTNCFVPRFAKREARKA